MRLYVRHEVIEVSGVFKGASDDAPYDYGDESSNLYAGLYPFTEGTADYTCTSYEPTSRNV